MPLSHSLWQTHQAIAQACLNHPFVQGIAQGTLPPAKFAFYVGQDSFFLEAFARTYSIAAAKAPDWQTFCLFQQLVQGVMEELKLHQHYAADWGVNLRQIQPAAATRCYTDFLLATAWSRDISLIAVAMAPCLRLYAFLGQQLALEGIPEHLYSRWIQTYSQPEFDQLATQLESLIDQSATPTPAVFATYEYAMQCEQQFFQAAWEIPAASGEG